jgi:hypothetical protein
MTNEDRLSEQVAILQRALTHAQSYIDQLLAERMGYLSPLDRDMDEGLYARTTDAMDALTENLNPVPPRNR